MKLTLALLCAWCTIYCSNSTAVLPLSPTLITNAAADLKQQQQQQHASQLRHWKKDARTLLDSRSNGRDGYENLLTGGHNTLAQIVDRSDEAQQQQVVNLKQNLLTEYDTLLATATNDQPQMQATYALKNFTPAKYWARHCQIGALNCPQKYYHAVLAARNQAAVALQQQRQQQIVDAASNSINTGTNIDIVVDTDTDIEADNADSTNTQTQRQAQMHISDNVDEHALHDTIATYTDYSDEDINNEIILLLTGEQDLIKFLHWAMKRLYPYNSDHAVAYYHPSMVLWRNLNMSGQLEPPLIVDEPRYIYTRREYTKDNLEPNDYEDDPFIPPRGRKHNMPILNALLHRSEIFVPNRGKRNKIKDIFNYDDLFYPNRGKKQRELDKLFKIDDPFFPNRGKKLRDIHLVDDPFFPQRGKRTQTDDNIVNDHGEMSNKQQLSRLIGIAGKAGKAGAMQSSPLFEQGIFGKLQKRKLSLLEQHDAQQHVVSNEINNNDVEKREWPVKMSTHKVNGYDQSVKPSKSAIAAAATTAGDELNEAKFPEAGTTPIANRFPLTTDSQPQPQNLRFSTNSIKSYHDIVPRFWSGLPSLNWQQRSLTGMRQTQLLMPRSIQLQPKQQQQQQRPPETQLKHLVVAGIGVTADTDIVTGNLANIDSSIDYGNLSI